MEEKEFGAAKLNNFLDNQYLAHADRLLCGAQIQSAWDRWSEQCGHVMPENILKPLKDELKPYVVSHVDKWPEEGMIA